MFSQKSGEITAKKSFTILLRLFFILFSLHFIRDALYIWDGYSYYMRFTDFLPDLSLSFILWTIIGVITAFIFWLIVYGLFKLIPKSLIPVRLEDITTWSILFSLIFFIKKTFFRKIVIHELIKLNYLATLIIGGLLMAIIVWYGRRYSEKILYKLNTHITPLIWLFGILFILAIPLCFFKNGFSKTNYTTPDSADVISQEVRVEPQRRAKTTLDKRRPNIILVVMDALTTLDMQAFGYERPTTPFISEWAKDAIMFKNVYAASNWTTPSMMSVMTGQRVWTHRVWYRAIFHPVSNYENNLPKILKDYGYNVYGLVQNIYAHPKPLGIEDAFLIKDAPHSLSVSDKWWYDRLADLLANRPIVQNWIFDTNLIGRYIRSFSPDVYVTPQPSELVYNSFLKYILKNKHHSESGNLDKPFFAWLHVLPPHDPYLPPQPYMGMFGDAKKFNSRKKQDHSLHREYDPDSQADIDALRTRYDELILYSDQQFKSFLSRLAETMDMANTIVILLSDHGESFSHGYQGHIGPHLYEQLIRVPLIIKLPGKTEGKIIDIPIGQIDIAPTILDLVDIHVPKWMEGRSLTPLFEGKPFNQQPVFSMQFINNRSLGQPITKGTIAVRDGDYKLIYYLEDEKTLLFNLNSDPEETQNISEKEPEITQRLMKLINDNLSLANSRITQSSEN